MPVLNTISLPVISGLIKIADLVLIFASAWIIGDVVIGDDNLYLKNAIMSAALISSVTTTISLKYADAYRHNSLLSLPVQLSLSVKPLIIGMCSMIIYLFLFYDDLQNIRIWPLAWLGFTSILLFVIRYLEICMICSLTNNGRLARKVAVVGVSAFSEKFIERLREAPHAYQIIGLYDDRHSRVPNSQAGVEVLGTVEDLLERSQQETIDLIVISLPLSAVDRIASLLQKLGPSVADICLTTDLVGLSFSSRQIGDIGRNPVISIRDAPLKDWRAIQKSAMDYTLGSLALLIMFPILIVAAIAIKIDSSGPIVFRQPRMGFNNKLFVCYKFRSMHFAMTDLLADRQTTRNDPRVTRVGRVIRKLSIDELPQIFNVLNGTMSLVGPRPHAPNTKAADRLFAEVVQQYALRHRVKPGITGWAQANGWRGETKTLMQIEQRVAYDLFYIENWSLIFDVKIIGMTIWNEIRSKHAF